MTDLIKAEGCYIYSSFLLVAAVLSVAGSCCCVLLHLFVHDTLSLLHLNLLARLLVVSLVLRLVDADSALVLELLLSLLIGTSLICGLHAHVAVAFLRVRKVLDRRFGGSALLVLLGELLDLLL